MYNIAARGHNRKAIEIFGNNVEIKISTRANKKYMIKNGNKWVHFGDINYEDYTYHNDDVRRNYFRASLKSSCNIFPEHFAVTCYS